VHRPVLYPICGFWHFYGQKTCRQCAFFNNRLLWTSLLHNLLIKWIFTGIDFRVPNLQVRNLLVCDKYTCLSDRKKLPFRHKFLQARTEFYRSRACGPVWKSMPDFSIFWNLNPKVCISMFLYQIFDFWPIYDQNKNKKYFKQNI
jgi:hypothetical protein